MDFFLLPIYNLSYYMSLSIYNLRSQQQLFYMTMPQGRLFKGEAAQAFSSSSRGQELVLNPN